MVVVLAFVVVVVVAGFGGASMWRRYNHLLRGNRAATDAGTALDPSYFATGSCMSFPPTTGDRHLTVFLDPGHGGLDPGGVGTTESGQTIEESEINLPIALDTMALLRSQGFTVVLSRTTNSSVVKLTSADVDGQLLTLQGSHDDVAARDVCANLAHADLLVGIYQDAGGTSANAGSVSVYDDARPFSAANVTIANLLENDVLAAMNSRGWGIPDDGVQSDAQEGSAVGDPGEGGLAALAANYDHLLLLGPAEAGYFTTPSQMPGAVVEPLYLTDPFEGSIADGATGQEVIARGIAHAIEQYFTPHPAKTTSTTG